MPAWLSLSLLKPALIAVGASALIGGLAWSWATYQSALRKEGALQQALEISTRTAQMHARDRARKEALSAELRQENRRLAEAARAARAAVRQVASDQPELRDCVLSPGSHRRLCEQIPCADGSLRELPGAAAGVDGPDPGAAAVGP